MPALDIREVHLTKNNGQPFGFKITSSSKVKGVSVSAIVPGGAAESSGLLFVGDVLLSINDEPVLHSNHDFCVDCTRVSPPTMKLVVTREINEQVCTRRVF